MVRAEQRKPFPGARQHGRLVEAHWLAAQLAYLRDLDMMTERMNTKGKGKGKDEDAKKDG